MITKTEMSHGIYSSKVLFYVKNW